MTDSSTASIAKATVRASHGSAYVAPYYDLINPSTYVSAGTLNLSTGAFKPETSSGYDLGSDFNVGRSTLISFDGYLTNIFNRYASVTSQTSGVFDGKPYTQVTQNGNQANVRQEGIELKILRAPRVGFGLQTAVDLLRDYAYGQNPNVGVASVFGAGTPDRAVLFIRRRRASALERNVVRLEKRLRPDRLHAV